MDDENRTNNVRLQFSLSSRSKTTENTNIISSTFIYYTKPSFTTAYYPEYRPTRTQERRPLPTKSTQPKKKLSTRNRPTKTKINSVYDTHFEHTIRHPVDQHSSVKSTLSHPESTTLPSDINSWEVDMQIPSVLTDLLKKENPRLAEIAETLSEIKPKWPITSSRADHRDDDVFIARANNPFGHSTKWMWRYSTQTYKHLEIGTHF